MTPNEALALAVESANYSGCAKSRRGVVIFRDIPGGLVCFAWNDPPHPFACDGSDACRAVCNRVAVHAEDRALRRAGSSRSAGADLLHVKVVDGAAVASGPPSCWQCSRAIVDAGILGVWLLHEAGLRRYGVEEFHDLTLRECGLYAVRVPA